MAPQPEALLEILKLEYETLKKEQLARIGYRDNLIYATLGVIFAVVVASAQAKHPEFLVAIAPGTVILGWVHLLNDIKVNEIRAYIREHLAPAIAAQVGTDQPAFAWEADTPLTLRQRQTKLIQLVLNLSLFCGVGLVAELAFGPALNARFTGPAAFYLTFGFYLLLDLLIALLAVQYFQNSGLRLRRRRRPADAAGAGGATTVSGPATDQSAQEGVTHA